MTTVSLERGRVTARVPLKVQDILDAKDEMASRFYRRYGFSPASDQPLKLFLALW
jgi:hypothetical protein